MICYMPYEIRKVFKGYAVINTQTGHVHAYRTTLEKAKKQVRLLYMLENR
jgi:hypothetical protein